MIQPDFSMRISFADNRGKHSIFWAGKRKKIGLKIVLNIWVFFFCGAYTFSQTINTTTNFPDPNFRIAVEQLMGVTHEGDFTATQAAAKNDLLNCANRDITDVTGLAFFTSITTIFCYHNKITQLDLSHNTALINLECYENQLTQLDLSNNTAMQNLSCRGNQLTQLDLSHNPALQTLYCFRNPLTQLDVSHNPALLILICEFNQLIQLDVSANPALQYLSCNNNQLTQIDVSHNPVLQNLNCGNNQLTQLDITNNPELQSLYCDNNQLTQLDVSHNPALQTIICSNNQLTQLDVSNLLEIQYLECRINHIISLSSFVTNTSLGAGDHVDVRWNDLDFFDWDDTFTLLNRIGNPTFSQSVLISGFAFTPQNNLDPFDDSTPTPTKTPTNTPTPEVTNTPTPTLTFTPTPIQEIGVYVFDNVGEPWDDLTGKTDFDPAGSRNLTIFWNTDQGVATDWHVYVRKGLDGLKYLGRTADGNKKFLDWFAGAPNIESEFKNGPDFNSVYTFRVIRIDNTHSTDDIFDQKESVGFNLAGGNPIKLTQPVMPNLNPGQVSIYDDILGGNDLAPMGSSGADLDTADARAIQIAWNFNVDPSTVDEYHVQIKVDNNDFEFLGQTYTGKISYFLWTTNKPFSTITKYANGPEDGHTYQFKVFMIPFSGKKLSLTSGILNYSVQP